MSINLSKGGRINLAKEAPGLTYAAVGLGWDLNNTDTGTAYDLDASVFLLAANGKIVSEEYFIFYNNKKSPDGAVEHLGDSRTGEASGDDETILIDLAKINPAVEEMVFVVTIHDAETRRQNFGQIRNAYIKIYDNLSLVDVANYDLDEDFSRETAVEFGRLYKKDGEWRFQAVGQGYNSGLQSFVEKYT